MLDSVAFPPYRSVDAELRKAGLLRFVLGVVVFVRFFQIFSSYSVYMSRSPISPLEWAGMAAFLLCTLCFTVGFLTQLATALLACGAVITDHHFGSRTLGTDVLAGVLFVLFVLNSGQRYSIDRLILARGGGMERVLRPLQWFCGASEMRHIKMAYVMGGVFYALLSFVALSYHLADPYWVSGLTTKSLFTNSYLCKHYQFFRYVESVSPGALSVFSIFSAIGQSVFQAFMIPLMFCRWGRRFVCFWGGSFILVSLIFINLSYLPHVELVLWLLIFYPSGSAAPTAEIVYDDRCNLCLTAMRILSFVDLSGVIRFLPASRSGEVLAGWGVRQDEIATYMVGKVRGKIYRAYDLYLAVAKEKALLWPFVPILVIGSVSGFGPRVYEEVAKRRRALFGTCKLGATHASQAPGISRYPSVGRFVRQWCYGSFAICSIFFVLVEAPVVRMHTGRLVSDSAVAVVRRSLNYLGFEAPNVFNEADLSMSDRWLEMSVLTTTGAWELVPFRGRDGERLNYGGWDFLRFTNHNSDFLYFGETLQLSRRMIAGVPNPAAFFSEGGIGFQSVTKRIRYDYFKRNRTGVTAYRVQLKANRSSRVSHWRSEPQRFETQVLYDALYQYDGNGHVNQLPVGHNDSMLG